MLYRLIIVSMLFVVLLASGCPKKADTGGAAGGAPAGGTGAPGSPAPVSSGGS